MAFAFEWDPRKAAANERKHGVSFDEAATAFADPYGLVVDDPRHSVGEVRVALLGHAETGRLLAVMFTERGDRSVPGCRGREWCVTGAGGHYQRASNEGEPFPPEIQTR